MIRINLVPREILAREEQKRRAGHAIAGAAAAIFIVLAVSILHWHKAARLEAQLLERKQKLERLQDIVSKVQALEESAKAVKIRLGVITDLLKGRPLYPYFMADFAQTLPQQVWLSQLGAKSQPNNQIAVTAAAGASTSEGIAEWLRNLGQSSKFSEPTLSAIAISGAEGAKTHTFSITTTYKGL